MKKYFFIILIVIISSACYAKADRDSLLFNAIHEMLNENFDQSEILLDSLAKKYPGDPVPAFFKGVLTFGKSSYVTNYKRFDKLSLNHWENCVKRCDELLKININDAYALFFKGGSQGYIATLQTRKKSYLKAGFNVYKSMKSLYKALELDSTYYDIYYGMGLYHVVAANSPGILKFLQKILPIPNGDEDFGFSCLEKSYRKGRFSPLIVQSMLSFFHIYYRTDYEKGLDYILPLLDKYPQSSDFMMIVSSLYAHQGFETGETEWQKMLNMISKVETRFKIRSEKIRGYYFLKILFLKGYANFKLERYDLAKMYLKSLVDNYKKNSYTGIANSLLGMIEDLEGNRESAISFYKKANKQKKYGNMKELISLCLKEPYNSQKHQLLLKGFFVLPDRP